MHKPLLRNVCAMLGLVALTACAAPTPPPPTSTATPDAAATSTRVAQLAATGVAATATAEQAANDQVSTSVAATLTAQPTATPLPTSTPVPSATPSPSPAPTETALPTATATKKPAVATQPATGPTATKASGGSTGGSIYSSYAGGPHGYTAILGCTYSNGKPCETTMPTGDVSFSIVLRSSEDALLAIFVPFGLSVEKDGANLADAYMTVDAGWLPPGSAARFGTSYNFRQPGHYVIRTSGCLITEASYPNCSWGTVDGTVITFDIK